MSELASFSESSRQSTLQRFQLLRAHFEDGRSLAAIAREAKISYRTLQYWLERYRTSGLAALARKPRIDRGKCRKSTASLSRFLRASAVIFLGGGRPLAIVPVDHITTEFRRVYVIPDYRRQGIAAKLIRWLEERARAGGFRSIRLATGVKQPEAIALYERLGYVSSDLPLCSRHFPFSDSSLSKTSQ
jgi:GNAT superfamily N-acetyltransferase